MWHFVTQTPSGMLGTFEARRAITVSVELSHNGAYPATPVLFPSLPSHTAFQLISVRLKKQSLPLPTMTSTVSQVITKTFEPLDKSFTDSNGVSGSTVYIPQDEDLFASGNYFISLRQPKPNTEEETTILYPLYYLDKLGEQLCAIRNGLMQEIWSECKFDGIGRKLLAEYQGNEYFIEFKGGYETLTKIIQKKGEETKVIELKNATAFNIMLEKVDRHADKYLENLAIEENRNIAQEREEIKAKQVENNLKRTNSTEHSVVAKKQKIVEKVDKASEDNEDAGSEDEEEEDWSWYIPHQLNIGHNFHFR